MQFSNQRFVTHTRESAQSYRQALHSESGQLLAVEGTQGLVGTMSVSASAHHGTADIGLLIGVPYVSMGLGREAVGGLAQELSRQGVRKVTIGTSARNRPMQRIAEHLGFTMEGQRIRQEIIEGQEVDLLYYALFRC